MTEAQLVAEQRTHIMREQVDAIELERVHQLDDVDDHLVPGAALAWRIGPPGAAQILSEDPMALSKSWQHLAPLPPVLREPVEQQDRLAPPQAARARSPQRLSGPTAGLRWAALAGALRHRSVDPDCHRCGL
jgi:hypothetical protein